MRTATTAGPGVRFFVLSHLVVALFGIVLGAMLATGGAL
jgi:hypothetical protein